MPEKEGSTEEDEMLVSLEQDEVDIAIHFHCQHCICLNKCIEKPRVGWSCQIIWCPNGCSQRFHNCKMDEHRLLCSHERVQCINSGYGCPVFLLRHRIARHLSACSASVVVCGAEWNRWCVGTREREKVSMGQHGSQFVDPNQLDVAFALSDQDHLNEKRKFYSLPNGLNQNSAHLHQMLPEQNCSGERTEGASNWGYESTDRLAPGLSLSVCTELRKVKTGSIPTVSDSSSSADVDDSDDFVKKCCNHGIMKSICHLCCDDPEAPKYQMGVVWREKMVAFAPGTMEWIRQPRVEKVLKRGLFDALAYQPLSEEDNNELMPGNNPLIGSQKCPSSALTGTALSVELALKHYSRHQVKPKGMFTFQCLQNLRRDEYLNHYRNVHCEIHQGLDGWLLQRCPLHVYGCAFTITRLQPGHENLDVTFRGDIRAFGVRCNQVDSFLTCNGLLRSQDRDMNCQLLSLPAEILCYVASFLDAVSLSNLSCTCQFLREVCDSMLNERGIILQDWIQSSSQGRKQWKLGPIHRAFSNAFAGINNWCYTEVPHMSNHLMQCPFNQRVQLKEKFAYV